MVRTCIAFPLNVLPQEMNSVDLSKLCAIRETLEADPKEGLVMIHRLEVRTDLNHQFGTVQRYARGNRVVIRVAETGELVKIKEENVTNHHKVTLTGLCTERYNGCEGVALSLKWQQQRVLREEEGEICEAELRYEIRLDGTNSIHHVLRENFVASFKSVEYAFVNSLSALRQYWTPGGDIIFFDTQELLRKRRDEELRGVLRGTDTSVLWPDGPELVVSQVLAHFESLSISGVPRPASVTLTYI
jgi:hypothetical protein